MFGCIGHSLFVLLHLGGFFFFCGLHLLITIPLHLLFTVLLMIASRPSKST